MDNTTFKKYIFVVLILLTVCITAALAAGGESSDPLVSLSYIETIFRPAVINEAKNAADTAISNKLSTLDKLASDFDVQKKIGLKDLSSGTLGWLRLIDKGYMLRNDRRSTVRLSAGERIILSAGGDISLLKGSGQFVGARSAIIIDSTIAAEIYPKGSITLGHQYILANDRIAGVMADSNGTEVAVTGNFQLIPKYIVRHTDAANALTTLGLMKGTNTGLELDRSATRLEALIMFLRLIGEEQNALAYTGTHPFNDVPWWAENTANKYVGYAYSKGYTKGISETAFGSTDTITSEQYVTFILRALGYTEGKDFIWSSAPESAAALGILSKEESESSFRSGFYRDMTAYLSWRALFAHPVGSNGTLLEKLINKGVVSNSAAFAFYNLKPVIIE